MMLPNYFGKGQVAPAAASNLILGYPRKLLVHWGGGGFKCVDYSNYVHTNVLCTFILRICKYLHILHTVLHYVHINVVFLTIGQNSLSW
jgi:hypothetical protein